MTLAIDPIEDVRKPLRQYDHSALLASVRATDVFLATYPKSGTTWLGYLIAQVVKTDPEETLDLKTFNKYVPDVNFAWTKKGTLDEHSGKPDPRFFLVHARCHLGLPKVVYVLRDPRDVILSYWHYKKFLSTEFKLSLLDFIASNDHWPCHWDEHVASWLAPRAHPNLLVVRYEDMLADAGSVLKKVLDFAEAPYSKERLKLAVESGQFSRMRSAEEKFGVHGAEGDKSERFVRKGKAGSWREEMGEMEVALLERRYGRMMHVAGYETVTR